VLICLILGNLKQGNESAIEIVEFPTPAKDVVNTVLSGNPSTPKTQKGKKTNLISNEGKVVKAFTINQSLTQLHVFDL